MTESQARDELSEYPVFRFEKVNEEGDYDIDGRKVKSTWRKVVRTAVQDLSKADAARSVRWLNKHTRSASRQEEVSQHRSATSTREGS